jgi:MoaA/NifB/PqqE/SkfB family radical SAM enzyme
MGKVVEIVWFPTARCNCRCPYCGVQFDAFGTEEMSGAAVANALRNSEFIASDVSVAIAGGEPFLKNDLPDFVLPVLREFENSCIGITTNGTCFETISDFAETIPNEYRSRISFAISVDGTNDTHNNIRNHKNAYSLALASAEMLSGNGFGVSINTVIHSENISELNELKQDAHARCGEAVRCIFIPIVTDVAKYKTFPYTDEEIKGFFSYLKNDCYEKYVCAYGLMQGDCNAGEKNTVILPSGEMYTCCLGSIYKTAEERQRYCIGSLLDGSFDAVWIRRRESGALDVAKHCARCNSTFEIEREHRYFGFSYKLTHEEIRRRFDFSGEDVYWESGWHELETYEGGSHRWMSATEASVICHNGIHSRGRVLSLSYFSSVPANCYDTPMLLEISLNGKIYLSRCVVKDEEEIEFFIDEDSLEKDMFELSVRVNRLWKPSDVFGNSDERELGIAVRGISIAKR